eukprot:11536868-Heterocapsa_arctica.AAC.1
MLNAGVQPMETPGKTLVAYHPPRSEDDDMHMPNFSGGCITRAITGVMFLRQIGLFENGHFEPYESKKNNTWIKQSGC